MCRCSRFVRCVWRIAANGVANGDSLAQATIRVVGGLLSAHLLLTDRRIPFGETGTSWYKGELLYLAKTLAEKLLPAFDSATGIPYPRVHLKVIHKLPQ